MVASYNYTSRKVDISIGNLQNASQANSASQFQDELTEVTKTSPCPHCHKPDWCYSIGKLSVCNRDAEPATGWERTSKTDRNGKPYYAPATAKKSPRPQGKEEYVYTDVAGKPLIKVTVVRPGKEKGKDVFQSYFVGGNWVKASEISQDQKKKHQANLALYRYQEVRQAITQGQQIFVVEGEGKADLLWRLGIPATTSIGGASKYRAYGNYKEQLTGADLVLCPDRDEPGLKHMEDINSDFPEAKWLYAPPSPFFWEHLPKSQGLDIADWVKDGATVDVIREAVGEKKASAIEAAAEVVRAKVSNDIKSDTDDIQFLENSFNPDEGNFGEDKPCKHKLQYLKVKKALGKELRFNLMTQQVERNGNPIELDGLHIQLAKEFNIQISKGNAPDIVLDIAKDNSYHPVKDYLLQNYDANKNVDASILNDISTRYFGTTEDIYNVMMRKTLIGAVARVLDPGCKFDTATILQGDQDIKKSTFWETLAGKDWFDDTFDEIENKDDLSKLTRYWCVEFAEFENVTTKKAAGAVKKFLSTKSDRYRVPYGRSVKEFPRSAFIVGSVNPVGILNDPTGDRRFWVIPVKKNKFNQIDIKRLQRERNALWAAATKLYFENEIFYLTDAEKTLANESNKDFQIQDSWEPYVTSYLIGKDFVTVGDVLMQALDIAEKSKHDRMSQARVTGILRRYGWEQCKKRISGKEVRGWGVKPTVSPLTQVLSHPESQSQQGLQELSKNDCLTTVSSTVSARTQSQQGLQPSETDETLKSAKLLNFENQPHTHCNGELDDLEKNKVLDDFTVSSVSTSEVQSGQSFKGETLVRQCPYRKGVKVRYKGNRFTQFNGLILSVYHVEGSNLYCVDPDDENRFTGWMRFDELELVDGGNDDALDF